MTCFRADTNLQTIVFGTDGGVPEVIWWGASLSDDEDLAAVAAAVRYDLTGGGSINWRRFFGVPRPGGTPALPVFAFDHAERSGASLPLVSKGDGLTLIHRIPPFPSPPPTPPR